MLKVTLVKDRVQAVERGKKCPAEFLDTSLIQEHCTRHLRMRRSIFTDNINPALEHQWMAKVVGNFS